MLEFMCWLKGFFLGLSIAATMAGGIIAAIGVVVGIVYLVVVSTEKFENRFPTTSQRLGILGKTALGLVLLALVTLGTYVAKQEVCARGFKQSYREFFDNLFTDSQRGNR